MAEIVRYRGILALHGHGEADDILFLDNTGHRYPEDPLAETISDDLDEHGRYASVRYWTADTPMPDEAIMESAVRTLLGDIEAEYGACYSEITGYLWTDEDINVGGHDLLEELKAQAGRYCLLEISYARERSEEESGDGERARLGHRDGDGSRVAD